MVKEYAYNDNTKLSEHFKVSEFKCKCGGTHNTLIDSDLVNLLEAVRGKLNASSANIYSGYRCKAHDKSVGGSGSGPHTLGYAVDMYFLDKDRKRIPCDKVCIALEDIGHTKGIGTRCGGSSIDKGCVHIDTKNRHWFGDESINFNNSIGSFKAPSDNETGHNNYLDYYYVSKTMYCTGDSVRIRKENNLECEVVGHINKNDRVDVYYTENGFAKIGVAKWVSLDYLQAIPVEIKTEIDEANEHFKDEEEEKKISLNDFIKALIELIVNIFKK